MVASPLFQIFHLGKQAESHLIIWQAPRAGGMRRLLCSDWLPERARWSDTAAREYVGHTHTGKFLLLKGLFALHRKIWFGVCKKIENFVITNFFVFVIAFALETC